MTTDTPWYPADWKPQTPAPAQRLATWQRLQDGAKVGGWLYWLARREIQMLEQAAKEMQQ